MSNRKNQKVTLADIAATTGYSVNTVSRALKDKSDISAATRQFIKAEAQNRGYIADSLAGSLRSGSSHSIAIILGDIANPHFGLWVREIQMAAKQLGYNTWVINTNEDPQLELEGIRTAIGNRVDGIIICPTQENQNNIHMLRQCGIPFVLLGRRWPDKDLNYVIPDDEAGGYLATRHLLNLGCRQILFLNGPGNTSSAKEREMGFCKAMSGAGQPIDRNYIHSVGLKSSQCRNIVQQLIDQQFPFDGILAFSDLIALEAQTVLAQQPVKRSVPFVGFDDILESLQLPVTLSSVASAEGSAASHAVEILLQLIASKRPQASGQVQQLILQVRLFHHTSSTESSF